MLYSLGKYLDGIYIGAERAGGGLLRHQVRRHAVERSLAQRHVPTHVHTQTHAPTPTPTRGGRLSIAIYLTLNINVNPVIVPFRGKLDFCE